MDAPLYNLKNETAGTVTLPEEVFGARWNPKLVAQVVRAQLANRRRPWAHAKGRGEVRGGGKKPWRQKGTGRARHGSIRSPLWVGGGKAHGPRKDRDYSQRMPKEMRRRALYSALSKKLIDKEVTFFDTLSLGEPKTKLLAATLRPLLGMDAKAKKFNVLLVGEGGNTHMFRASANLPATKAVRGEDLNVYDVLRYGRVFVDQHALNALERRPAPEKILST